jgi:hypothetical protein
MLNLLQKAVCGVFRGAVAHGYMVLSTQVNLSNLEPLCTGQGKALAAASSHYLQLLMPALAFLSVSTCLQRYLQAQVRRSSICADFVFSLCIVPITYGNRFRIFSAACHCLWNFNFKTEELQRVVPESLSRRGIYLFRSWGLFETSHGIVR